MVKKALTSSESLSSFIFKIREIKDGSSREGRMERGKKGKMGRRKEGKIKK